jgi:hypothetical protein
LFDFQPTRVFIQFWLEFRRTVGLSLTPSFPSIATVTNRIPWSSVPSQLEKIGLLFQIIDDNDAPCEEVCAAQYILGDEWSHLIRQLVERIEGLRLTAQREEWVLNYVHKRFGVLAGNR